MNVLDTAKAQVKQLVEKVTERPASTTQAVTIGKPRDDVKSLLHDADRLSQVFGDVAEVRETGPDRLRWTFGDDGPTWDCIVSSEADTIRYVDVQADSSADIVVDLRDAPGGRGTEVIARISTPAPGVLTGVLLYKALYRARALLQTGEVPTLQCNPSARDSTR
ncbi:hypothetical protein [Mycolicibacterium sediminis]|uniref:Cyclase n=1 Tax=Mycolicibacterium sediminis TaxID=1286180 RepID=A0A7I7QKA5_9MYCO|nr:hypothetical protein [Mycolicibacterium sediminis]BBY26758.1 hypothetical protein MSEDJ_08540 [Mycolicibacterium sediminis]